MRCNKLWRLVVLAVFVAAVAAAAVFSHRTEENSIMGVPVVSEAEMSRFTSFVPQEISSLILCDGEIAAVDKSTFTVYISQNIKENTGYKELVGRITTQNPGWELYFAEDEMFADLDRAVAENHPFRLVVATGENEYMEYGVVFTTLPVVRIEGQQLYTMPETG
ncbi:MAG: hypothetical protein IIV99_03865, partial [Oscillospiraceae bacterium]|nr:hypothetical protein [Oscillospiraceae bacterium]